MLACLSLHASISLPPSHSAHLKSRCCHQPDTLASFHNNHTLFPQKSPIVDLVQAELGVVGLRLHAECPSIAVWCMASSCSLAGYRYGRMT